MKKRPSGSFLFLISSIGFGIVLVGFAVYFGISYYIFNQLTSVVPHCEAAFLEGERDNVPTNFYAQYNEEDNLIAVPDYGITAYEDVEFSARGEDLTLSGWFIPAASPSEDVVIVVHGFRSCKRNPTVLIPAGMLHRAGFNVLMFDVRNHGESDSDGGYSSAGSSEYVDALGAFDYLRERGFESENIGLMGLSFGGAVSTIAFGEEPEIAALWVDSTYGNIEDVIANELQRAGFSTIFVSGSLWVADLNNVPVGERSSDEAIQNHNGRPIAITHGTADERIPYAFGQQLHANAGQQAQFITFDDMDHVEAVYHASDAYEAELIAFFTAALSN